ncbi:MAG: tetratricopeptide repeat protein [Leptolyngbyaceae cyanobacterium SL_7_1]|nr:tetratricopeptide repeat protein [Leptolyngbyaceae cyanobacterium SL_7_1]
MQSLFSDPDYLLHLATQYLESNQLVECIAILEKIVALYPMYGPAYNHLGWIAMSFFHQLEQAKIYYQKAIECSPNYPVTYVNYAKTLNFLEEYQLLAEVIEQAIRLPPVDKAKIYEEAGKMYEKQHKLKDAIAAYQQAIQQSLDITEVEDLLNHLERCRLKLDALA